MKLNSQSIQCWKIKIKKNQLKKLPESTSYTYDSGHETKITS